MKTRPNIIRTLLFNLRAFPLRTAVKLPVYVYGAVKVLSMGRIELNVPAQRGMWKIGMLHENSAMPYTIFNNQGTIELNGRAWLHHGSRLTNKGRIVFGRNVIISHETVMDIREQLVFGHDISVGFGTEFTDSDMHFMVDVNTREVKGNRGAIEIGSFNWLGSHTFIKKGTRTPDYLTVASPNTVLLRDYTTDVEPNSILAGAPAKVIASGKRRVLNFRNEAAIRNALYGSAPQSNYVVPADVDLDDFCKLV